MLHELRWELCITSGHMLDTRAMKWVLFSILWLYSWGPKCPALVTLPQCCLCSHHSFNHSLLFLSDILDLISFNLLCPYTALSSGGEVHGKCYAFTKILENEKWWQKIMLSLVGFKGNISDDSNSLTNTKRKLCKKSMFFRIFWQTHTNQTKRHKEKFSGTQ